MGNYFNWNSNDIMRHQLIRLPRLISLILFMLLCACTAYWSMRFLRPPLRAIAMPPHNEESKEIDISHAFSLFGAQGLAAVVSNYQLSGVVVAQQAGKSVAILSMDGKPAQTVMQGKELQPGISMKEVHSNYVVLSKGGILERVMLPDDAKLLVISKTSGSR